MMARAWCLFLAALLAAPAAAQTYPTRPVRLVVGFPPGGGVDINARLLAPKLAEYLGQPFVVENRPGAGTNIANELVARAQAAPGRLNYSSAGVGTTQHLAAELFKLRTKSFIVHIPYKGSAPSLTALMAAEVELSFANIPAIQAHVKSGRLRALANAIIRATRDPETRRRLLEQGAVPVGNTPEEFGRIMREDWTRWAEVVKISGARAD